MAAPNITNVTFPDTVLAGAAFDVSIEASDPDARPARLVAVVTDSRGNAATAEGIIHITDPLSYSLTDPDNVGWQVVQDDVDPSLFHVVAPG